MMGKGGLSRGLFGGCFERWKGVVSIREERRRMHTQGDVRGKVDNETYLNSANNLTHISFLTTLAFALDPSLPFNVSSSTKANTKQAALMGNDNGNTVVRDRLSKVDDESDGGPSAYAGVREVRMESRRERK